KSIGKESFELAKKANYNLGQIQSLFNIGAGFFHALERDSALFYYKKSYNLSKASKNEIWIMNLSMNLGQTYSDKYQFDSATAYYNISLENANKVKDTSAVGFVYNSIGVTLWKKGEFDKAIEFYKKSLNVLIKLANDRRIAISLNNIGAAYYQLGNYNIALEYFIESSKYRKKYSSLNSPVLLNSIGLIYLELQDTALAFNYFTEALSNAKTLNSILGQGYSYLNFGDYYFRQKKYSLALEYLSRAKPFYAELKDQNGIAKILNRIGLVYLETNQIQLAEKSFLAAYKKSKINELKQSEIESFINYIRIQIQRGEYDLAKVNLENTYIKAEKQNLSDSKLQILSLHSTLYEKISNYKKAFYYRNLYEKLKESLFNEKSLRIITDLKEKYEADKKEKENISLQYQNNIQKLEIENQAREKLYIIVVSIFSFFVIGYLIYLNTLRKRRNVGLLLAKKEVEIINKKLNETNKQLQNLNSTKDKFFSLISHDLKNPFGTLLGATQILKNEDGDLTEEDKKELIDIIASDSERLYALLENLLFWANSQTGKLKAKKSEIELYPIINDISNLLKSNAENKEIKIMLNIPENLMINFDEFMFSTIIRNLIINAIKFSFRKGKITIEATENGNKIHLKIMDEGIGIEKENLHKLFDEGSAFKQNGTEKEKGTGLGLILCRDFMKENDATINVESELTKGTTFELILPKVE
ncbi:MAG: tetratricopeptide repeat-containing sensor histidine kinase, partial [Bacteroidetes bacterium]|nr:tetratricopeptide repeat-containing sensor histidine kinase [Bacteroidota bacterium]